MAEKRISSSGVKRARGGASHLCPECGGVTKVVVTRRCKDGSVRRTRRCFDCKVQFKTREIPSE